MPVSGIYGERHGQAKLTDELVRQIRAIGKDVSNSSLARSVGVCRTTLTRARAGITWRHVEMPKGKPFQAVR
jgi:hypothetical protein